MGLAVNPKLVAQRPIRAVFYATGAVDGSPKAGSDTPPDRQAERLFLLKEIDAAMPLLARPIIVSSSERE